MVNKLPNVPVRVKQKIVDIIPISLDVLTFGWNLREFTDLENGKIVKAEAWTWLNGSANLNSAIRTGVRPIVNGMMQKQRIFGFEAMSYVLGCLDVPISPEECKALIEQAVKQKIAFGKLMRTSDWVTSPQLFDGKNSWELISEIKSLREEMDAKLNDALKASGSTLRLRGALKFKLVE